VGGGVYNGFTENFLGKHLGSHSTKGFNLKGMGGIAPDESHRLLDGRGERCIHEHAVKRPGIAFVARIRIELDAGPGERPWTETSP
jgi:hypothetical protein